MESIVAVIMVFGVPLSIIFSITYLKAKSMKLKAGGGIESRIVSSLKEENDNLRSRVENLEMIMSDSDLLKLKEFMEEERLKERAEKFRENY